MENLTKEYFDQKFDALASELKGDLAATEARLTKRIDDAQEELAAMTKRGFEDIEKRLDVRTEVEGLRLQMREVRRELNLS